MSSVDAPRRAWLIAGLCVIAAAPSPAQAAGHAAPARVVPSCDATPGWTLGQSATWRVFRSAERPRLKRDHGVLLACRRVPGPAATVVRLRPAGNLLYSVQIAGGRLLRQYLTQSGKYNPADVGYDLVDLDAGLRAASPAFAYGGGEQLPGTPTVSLLSGGGLLSWRSMETAQLDDTASGARSVASEPPEQYAVVPRGPAGTDVVYLADAKGTVSRLEASGPATTPIWTADASLTPVPNTARVARRPKERRRTLTVVAGSVAFDLVRRHGRSWVEVWGHRIASVDPAAPIRIDAQYGWNMLVTATFAGNSAPSSRLFNVTREAKPIRLLELTPPPGGWVPGAIAVDAGGAVAVVDGDTLRIWDPEPRTIEVPGIHDLAVEPGTKEHDVALFATDGTGQPRRFILQARPAN